MKTIVLYEKNGVQKIKNTTRSNDKILSLLKDLSKHGINIAYVIEDNKKKNIIECYVANLKTGTVRKQSKYYVEQIPNNELLGLLTGWAMILYSLYHSFPDNNKINMDTNYFDEIVEFMVNKNNQWIINEIWRKHYSFGDIGKKYIDNLFDKYSVPLKIPMKVCRTFDLEVAKKGFKGYVSTTLQCEKYWDYNKKYEFILPIGTMILPTRYNGINYCDNDEILVRLETLMKYKI